MIKNTGQLRKFEDDFIRNKGNLSYSQALKIFESMWYEGVKLGVLPPKDPLEGINVDINIAKVLNSCLKKSSPE